jgi:alkanesulfonate monooxygenase SsuD/methylene tetrahydromethanopterin reductase-like flavin-dependent oxidoreductase (luciferase family)
MLGYNICAAETDEEANYLRSSSLQSFLNLRRGAPTQLPPPTENFEASMDAQDRALLAQMSSCSAVGSLETIKQGMTTFVEKTGANELMLVCSIFEHKKRLHSFELAAEAGREIG